MRKWRCVVFQKCVGKMDKREASDREDPAAVRTKKLHTFVALDDVFQKAKRCSKLTTDLEQTPKKIMANQHEDAAFDRPFAFRS